ncbi:hypothetical protein [Aeromonas sanarellii]|uniref:hypothetical protein n=1 Tax=Aeromonas sanarellii TaxID=633415 RepID=UPI0039878A63
MTWDDKTWLAATNLPMTTSIGASSRPFCCRKMEVTTKTPIETTKGKVKKQHNSMYLKALHISSFTEITIKSLPGQKTPLNL